MPRERFELPIRIVVANPVPGLAIALQRSKAAKATLVPPSSQSVDAVAFDLEVTVAGCLPDGRPRLLGPYVQGPPEARFVYLSVGRYASQAASEWAGRVKAPLGGIAWEDIEALSPGVRLVARITGQSPKGGPALASILLLAPGWTSRIQSEADRRTLPRPKMHGAHEGFQEVGQGPLSPRRRSECRLAGQDRLAGDDSDKRSISGGR